jgi:hypothetical protein
MYLEKEIGMSARNRFANQNVPINMWSWLWIALLPAVLLLAIPPLTRAAESDRDDYDSATNSNPKLAAVRYVTWWSHDALGYHPAIYLRLENISGTSLIGERLRLQVRFTNVRTTDVTVARYDQRVSLLRNQQKDVMLRGPIPFELSIDQNAWPTIECKAMCRVGDVGDSGTQTLAITNLDRVTMTDDEAQTQLEKQPDLRRVSYPGSTPRAPDYSRRGSDSDQPEKPLIATAGGLEPAGQRRGSKFVMPASLPQLGDNFYVFERHFGLPTAIEAPQRGKTDVAGAALTWASYKPNSPFTNIFVASRNGASADVIILTLPSASDLKEDQILGLARELAGRGKSPTLGAFSHTVRYLSSGRNEFAEASSPSCKALTFKIPAFQGETAKVVLVLSRIAGDPESFVLGSAQRIRMLQVLLTR